MSNLRNTGVALSNLAILPLGVHVYVHTTSAVGQVRLDHLRVLVRVLDQITYRNELIGSFNTFCTCICPTGRLMAGIPLLFVREYALTLRTFPVY